MVAHEATGTISEDGVLSLPELAGGRARRVRVLVLEEEAVAQPPATHKEFKYERPFDPAVPVEDWECMDPNGPEIC